MSGSNEQDAPEPVLSEGDRRHLNEWATGFGGHRRAVVPGLHDIVEAVVARHVEAERERAEKAFTRAVTLGERAAACLRERDEARAEASELRETFEQRVESVKGRALRRARDAEAEVERLRDFHKEAIAEAAEELRTAEAEVSSVRYDLGEALTENARLTHLLGSHADGHRCTCTMLDSGTPGIEPPEWEQDPWCPTHPDMGVVTSEVDRLRSDLRVAEVGKSFGDLATKERDYERVKVDRLTRERDEARAEVERWKERWQGTVEDAGDHRTKYDDLRAAVAALAEQADEDARNPGLPGRPKRRASGDELRALLDDPIVANLWDGGESGE